MYIISGCLLGNNCKYNGGNNRNEKVIEFSRNHSYCIACPESLSGLGTPRPPAENIGGRIVDHEGRDVTDEFMKGAEKSLQQAMAEAESRGEKIEGAILKAKSPSCGSGKIYDGTFTGTLVDGDGCFTAMLKRMDIKVITEKEIKDGKF